MKMHIDNEVQSALELRQLGEVRPGYRLLGFYLLGLGSKGEKLEKLRSIMGRPGGEIEALLNEKDRGHLDATHPHVKPQTAAEWQALLQAFKSGLPIKPVFRFDAFNEAPDSIVTWVKASNRTSWRANETIGRKY